MTDAGQAYDDLIETGARIIAFSDLTGRALPRRLHELISEAADLRGAWDQFAADAKLGSADFDAVIDEMYARANALCCEVFGEVRYAGTADAGTVAAQMRELLGRA
jgi:hypothetical protein